ncbi:MAG: hypothetical protein JXA90_14505 [Planctomycetes bacterium]|nr:hypothetical protein [Planctomycetota bacterium]
MNARRPTARWWLAGGLALIGLAAFLWLWGPGAGSRAGALEELSEPLAREETNEPAATEEPASGGGEAGMQAPSPTVRQALQDLLSSDASRSRRGENILMMAGRAVVPQLRYWVQRMRFEADRVESLLRSIIEESGGRPPEQPLFLRDTKVGDFFHRKFLEARSLVQGGRYREARQIVEALLCLDKDSPIAWELRRMARQCRERMAAERLEPRIDADRIFYEVGEEPEVVFRLINRTAVPARIDLERGVLGELQVLRTVRTLDGSSSTHLEKIILATQRADKGIEIASGETWTEGVSVQVDKDLPLMGAVARVQIEGKFRPVRWELEGQKEDNISIHIVPAEFWVLPPAKRKGDAEPLKRLVAALVFDQAEDFLIGGQLSVWAGEKDPILNEKLVEILMDHVEDLDATRQRLALIFLRDATGRSFKEVSEWKSWWTQLREARRG